MRYNYCPVCGETVTKVKPKHNEELWKCINCEFKFKVVKI